MPEVDSRAALNGAKTKLTLDEFPDETFQGTIVRNSDSIDSASRTLNVEVDVDNPGDRIKTGAYVFVRLNVPAAAHAASQSVVVPANTLPFRAEGLRVGEVRDNHAVLVPIRIGRDYASTVEVIAGLKPTDQVIINPSDSLTVERRFEWSRETRMARNENAIYLSFIGPDECGVFRLHGRAEIRETHNAVGSRIQGTVRRHVSIGQRMEDS